MGGKVGRVEVKKVEARCKSELGVRVDKGARFHVLSTVGRARVG